MAKGGQKQLSLSRFFTKKDTNSDKNAGPATTSPKKAARELDKGDDSPVQGQTKKLRMDESPNTADTGGGSPAEPQARASGKRKRRLDLSRFESSEEDGDRRQAGNVTKEAKIRAAPVSTSLLESVNTNNNKSASSTNSFTRNIRPSSLGRLPHKMTTKLTPLESQYVKIKEENMDTLLFIEVGYKYKFFGEDAEIAAKELQICAVQDHCFKAASIPVHRLSVHLSRLVNAGYKVGVVRQTETAALKKKGQNKSGPFTRELVGRYTKATFISEDLDAPEGSLSLADTNYLMSIFEIGKDNDANSKIGILAVHCATGDIVFDEFEDTASRSELESRLAHMKPSEVILPVNLSKRTEKALSQLPAEGTDGGVRRERLDDDVFEYNTAFAAVNDFYKTMPEKSQGALNLPQTVISCLAAMISYLVDFKLTSVLKLTGNLRQFSSRGHCVNLGATTLRNLELFTSLADQSEYGTLFWVLNHTHTAFGKRLLRQWIGHPLVDLSSIQERLDAIEELLTSNEPALADLLAVMKKLPDLERSVTAIFYRRCNIKEFVTTLQALDGVRKCTLKGQASRDSFKSAFLRNLFQSIPGDLEFCSSALQAINVDAAKENKKAELFSDLRRFPEIDAAIRGIKEVEANLKNHKPEIRKALGIANFEYKSVSGIHYLAEVRNAQVKKVPKDWLKINSTKAASRFHSPYVIEQLQIMSEHKERLEIAAGVAWQQFLDEFADNYHDCRRVVTELASLDCFNSLSTVASQNGYTRPTFNEKSKEIKIQNGRHPVVDILLDNQFVPNDTHLEAEVERCMIITGPNMGGKSSYIRQVALISLMAQMGSFVPAESASLPILDGIYTRMGASDDICTQRSTFMVELEEASEILRTATENSLVIMDELGRGTSTHDGVAIAYATLHHMVSKIRCYSLFVTHYPSLATLKKDFPNHVGNFHMSFMPSEEDESRILFLFKLVAGAAARSYGLNVAALANIPQEIIEQASKISAKFEAAVKEKQSAKNSTSAFTTFGRVVRALNSNNPADAIAIARTEC